MSWRSRGGGSSAWHQCLAHLRQEAAGKGYVPPQSLQSALETLRIATADVQSNELAEDFSFLVQQLVGPSPSLGGSPSAGTLTRDPATSHAAAALCRLLSSLTSTRTVSLHGPAANLILSALRLWSDGAHDGTRTPTSLRSSLASLPSATIATPTLSGSGSYGSTATTTPDIPALPASPASPPAVPASAAASSLPVEAMTALGALLPDHLGLLSEHERAAQLTALMSVLVPQPLPSPQQPRGSESARGQRGGAAADHLDMQVLALNTLAACCGRNTTTTTTTTTSASAGRGSGLTADEAAALLSAAASLLQSCASRGSSRPMEDAAHSRLYAALVRALQAAIGEVRTAWVTRAAMLVEGLQRFLVYGAQASVTAATAAPVAAAPAPPEVGSGGGGGRYRPPHLRRCDSSQAEGGSLAWSDSDVSDTEHGAAGAAAAATTSGSGTAVVDRFRSSRVRLAVLSCIQAMAKSDPRAMHAHWSALLPLQNPLQPRPLTPHLITVLLFDPLIKVRALAAATIASLLDGPAQRSILAVAEAKSMSGRAPVRGFLTLSLSLGQLLLAAHTALLHGVTTESSTLVLPGLLRALVVLMAASPYERLPAELLPEVVKVLRARWAALTAGSASASGAVVATGELGPIQAAYLACLAECFSTKHPIPGLASFLQQQQPQGHQQHGHSSSSNLEPTSGDKSASASGGCGGGNATQQLVRDLLAVGRDAAAPAVIRIEALAALKGLAAHYHAALPPDVWENLRATASMGLSCTPPQPLPSGQMPAGLRSGPPSRSSSSSSLGVGAVMMTHGSPARPGDRAVGSRPSVVLKSHACAGGSGGGAAATGTSSACLSPEDKAAQLSVKLLSDYLSAIARQYGINRTDQGGGAGSGDGPDGGFPGAPPSPGFVPLAAAVARQQHQNQQQKDRLSPMSLGSGHGVGDDDGAGREAGMRQLVSMWVEAVEVMVPAATSHSSYMVRSAALASLGEVPEPVFSGLAPRLQQQLLTLLSDAAASDTVPAVRAAACKALGFAAAFPAVLAAPQLSDHVMRALVPGLRDAVMSVRIATGWAVANLCDAYRRRLEVAAGDAGDGGGDGDGGAEEQERAGSHAHASTSTQSSGPGGSSSVAPLPAGGMRLAAAEPPPPLKPHHYRQLAALCSAAITAMQDADKVRANGVRAVGNLLALLTPDMGPGLAAAGGVGGPIPAAAMNGDTAAAAGAPSSTSWRAARREAPSAAGASGGKADSRHRVTGPSREYGKPSGNVGSPGAVSDTRSMISSGGGSGSGAEGSFQLDAWLDSALTCLQSTLTTGGMKVQWNACCAAHSLLRNQRLLAHPRVATRVTALLLLLVMLVRESANFKIRTHAAAALAALPRREMYGDLLPDALLVVAGALESITSGSVAAPSTSAPGAGKLAGAGAGTETGQGDADGDVDGGEGRFPNYRYTMGLSAQLRATLLHLLALARPADARRVREAIARRADFLHTCLREQLAEAVQPLRAALAEAARGGGWGSEPDRWCSGGIRGAAVAPLAAAPSGEGSKASGALQVEVDLPADPFGLGARRGGSSPGGVAAVGGLTGLLEGLSLASNDGAADSHIAGTSTARTLDVRSGTADSCNGGVIGSGGRPCLTVLVGGSEEDEVLQRARDRVAALAAPLRGFGDLLAQLGPSVEPVLRDVEQALVRLQPP